MTQPHRIADRSGAADAAAAAGSIVLAEATPDTAGLGPDVHVLSVFVGSHIDAAVLDACPNLRLLATRSTGHDHIDLDACARRGVAVATVPTYGDNTVAEHTFALILSLSRNVHKAWLRTQRGDFGLDQLAEQADILTLHAPATPATHHLVDRRLLGRVKRGALLINTARGSLVDTQALLWALEEGILAGAGLDVLEGEEVLTEDRRMLAEGHDQAKLRALLTNQLLAGRDNVVVTPHMAFDSVEAVQRIIDTTAANIAGFLAGSPQHLVTTPTHHDATTPEPTAG